MKITSVEVRVVPGKQRLRGSAAILLDDCFKVRDILILEKENSSELHISMPCKKVGTKNYFVSLVHPTTSELRHAIEVAVLSEYHRLIEAGETETPRSEPEHEPEPVSNQKSDSESNTEEAEQPAPENDETESPTDEHTFGEEDDV